MIGSSEQPRCRASAINRSSSSRNRNGNVAADSPRSNPSSVFATVQPSLTPPTTCAPCVRASVKNTSQNSRSPLIVAIRRISTPGWSRGQSRKLMPWWRGAVGSVRVSRKTQFASCASDVHTFWPLMIHSSPCCSARVDSDARSDPEPGSE